MTKRIRLLVRILLSLILIVGFLLAKRAFAAEQEDYKTLSRQYDLLSQDFLRQKIARFVKGMPVVLYFKDGTQVEGVYQSYIKYDDSVWLKEEGHFFQTAYSVCDLWDIDVIVKGKV